MSLLGDLFCLEHSEFFTAVKLSSLPFLNLSVPFPSKMGLFWMESLCFSNLTSNDPWGRAYPVVNNARGKKLESNKEIAMLREQHGL